MTYAFAVTANLSNKTIKFEVIGENFKEALEKSEQKSIDVFTSCYPEDYIKSQTKYNVTELSNKVVTELTLTINRLEKELYKTQQELSDFHMKEEKRKEEPVVSCKKKEGEKDEQKD